MLLQRRKSKINFDDILKCMQSQQPLYRIMTDYSSNYSTLPSIGLCAKPA